MIPILGFTFIFHLMINTAYAIKRVVRSYLSAFIIAVFLLSLIGTSVFMLKSILARGSTVDIVRSWFDTCEPFATRASKKKIILRIDSVQAFAWNDIAIRLADAAIEKKISPVLSVVPGSIDRDQLLTTYIRHQRCHIEVALYGWQPTLGIPEFQGLSKEEARSRIKKGKATLEAIWGQSVVTFVPPGNTYSPGTRRALIDEGFSHISAETAGSVDYDLSFSDVIQITSGTGDQVLDQCRKKLAIRDLCILVVRPQDFLINGLFNIQKFKDYMALLNVLANLDTIDRLDVSFTTIKNMPLNL